MKMNIHARSNVLLWPTESPTVEIYSRFQLSSASVFLIDCPLPDIAKLTHKLILLLKTDELVNFCFY